MPSKDGAGINAATILHEALHSLLGLDDTQLQLQLGISTSDLSNNITQKLIQEGCGGAIDMTFDWLFPLSLVRVLSTFVIVLTVLIPILGQKPKRCPHGNGQNPAPKYRMGWRTYSVQGPKILFLAISVDRQHFSRDDMVALAHRLKEDFCKEHRLNVEILDDYKAARSFAPTTEKEWFQKHWRGTYLLDRFSGMEEISFSSAPDKPKDEIKINLAVPDH